MELSQLATRLIEADDAERRRLLDGHTSQAVRVELAYKLKEQCLEAWSSDPARATGAAAALSFLETLTDNPEVPALAAWTAGIAALIEGHMGQAIAHLNTSAERFQTLNQPLNAAATQVSKLYALAILGRYDEALECGLRAREVFLAHGDTLAAGRIEHNIGNIYWRRDRYQDAEHFLVSARDRFLPVNDHVQLAKIDNCLAYVHSLQHKFRSSEQLYERALARAEAAGLSVTQAEIEASMGNLALFQGRYDRALDLLERSRRRYAALGMSHQSAVAEQELADAYLELNLIPEAAAIYERVVPIFASLGMRAEQARALANHGRAALLLGQTEKAHKLLIEARKLYIEESNSVGEAIVTLTEAQLHYAEGDYDACSRSAERAEAPFAAAGAWQRLLIARWLHGEAARARGHAHIARSLLENTLRDAEAQAQPQVAQRCHTSLGLLAASAGDRARAEESFKQAIALVEDLRAPLPAEEFRTAFVSDKLTAYDELVRLCLDDADGARVEEALVYVEQARSRALVDRLGGAFESHQAPRDPFEAELLSRLEELRVELNWYYSQMNRPPDGDAAPDASAMKSLQEAVREREGVVLEITRQLQHKGAGALNRVEPLDIRALQESLGDDSALVEYTSLDGELLAFIVTRRSVEVVRQLGDEARAYAALNQFRFQIGALRYGSGRMRAHLDALTTRVRHYLNELYGILLKPLEERIGDRRLVVVPHRALHYVPFHALYDGSRYAIERREICYAPSAVVLRYCLARPQREMRRAVLLGVPDEQTPRVRDEIESLAPLFPDAVALLEEHATLAALHQHAPDADVLHLACHGQFRPDNPLFSSLRLSDGWLTVRDAYKLALNCGLVTLSACETGVSAVAPGDELIGLARGFFSAGAPTLLLSLWTVDDEATANLMTVFYKRLREGDAPAAALRRAQLQLLKEQPHPFFWSPFVLVGRW